MNMRFGNLYVHDYFYYDLQIYGRTLFKKTSETEAKCHLGTYKFDYDIIVEYTEYGK